jgi:hypothetical protein
MVDKLSLILVAREKDRQRLRGAEKDRATSDAQPGRNGHAPEPLQCIPMRVVLLAMLLAVGSNPSIAWAQDPPPKIGPWAVDVRGTFPRFPREQLLADSRGLDPLELPGRGLGLDLGAHVYLVRWKAITFGLGAQATVARATSNPTTPAAGAPLRPVTERLTALTPQLSFNFGTGDGWSYISGGLGRATWSIIPDGAQPGDADRERVRVVNYGGGARWFIKKRLAFTFDVRFHALDPGTPVAGRTGSPRTTLLFMGAGVSVR